MQNFPDVVPSLSSVLRRSADMLEVRFGGGESQVMPRFGGAAPQSEWQLVFANLPVADIARLDAFLESHGGVTAFRWQPPQGSRAAFRCASWQIVPVSAELATLRAVFRAVTSMAVTS